VKQQRDQLGQQLDAAKQAADRRIAAGAAQQRQNAAASLASDKAQLSHLQQLKQEQEDAFRAAALADRGLLTRLAARHVELQLRGRAAIPRPASCTRPSPSR
jgi:hypothetical protein